MTDATDITTIWNGASRSDDGLRPEIAQGLTVCCLAEMKTHLMHSLFLFGSFIARLRGLGCSRLLHRSQCSSYCGLITFLILRSYHFVCSCVMLRLGLLGLARLNYAKTKDLNGSASRPNKKTWIRPLHRRQQTIGYTAALLER